MNEQYIERYWRDATPADAIKEPPMVARFRDKDTDRWLRPGHLVGWSRHSALCWHNNAFFWRYCQVYDAPDPGEGWRLVDVDSEKPQAGDEFKYGNGWCYCNEFLRDTFYASNQVIRRRIEQPKPKYLPFTWEDREQLRGRIITFVDRNRTVEFRCESFSVDDDGFLVNDTYANWLCTNAVFVDTKESVGKKVAQ